MRTRLVERARDGDDVAFSDGVAVHQRDLVGAQFSVDPNRRRSCLRNTRDLLGGLLERLGGIDADDSMVSPPLKRGAGDDTKSSPDGYSAAISSPAARNNSTWPRSFGRPA